MQRQIVYKGVILWMVSLFMLFVTMQFMGDEEEYLESVRKDNQQAAEAQEKKVKRKKRTKNKS
jgi:hypothetical protein